LPARSSIAEKLKAVDALKARLLPLQGRFRTLDDDFSDQVSAYNRRHDDYNAVVKQVNSAEGRRMPNTAALNSERQSLQKEAGGLESQEQEAEPPG